MLVLPAFKTPVRYGQVIVLWLAIIVNYIHRINMSVGIVAMTNDKFVSNYGYPIYKWTEVEKSRVLSSFFWGYIALQIFFGNLVEKKGTKKILAVAVTLSSVCTVITPFAAEYGYMAVVALRVLEGLAQGALYPSLTVHVSKWVPPIERVGLLSLCLSGSAFSPLVGFPLCGYLAASSGGWPFAFYVPGALGFGWVALWLWIAADAPQDHKTITDAERSYIITACRQDMQAITKAKTPWKAIFTSVPVYAVLISSIVETWGFWTLLAEMPNYLSSVLDLDIKENGLLSSLPYLSAYMTSMLYTATATYIRKHFNISRTLHRNIWNSVALWGSSSILLILSLMSRPSTFTAVMLFVLTVSLLTAKYNGYMTNPIDLSPNFCGTLVGISSTVGTLGPILGPLCVGWLVDDPTSHEEWNSVFRLCSGIMFTGNLIYVIFSSSEVQPWNDQVERYALKAGKGATDVENGETKTRL